MNTTISKIDRNNINKKIIENAGKIIKEGSLVAFPTETVYGLGADGLNEDACKHIFEAKGRPSDNPLILHISNISMLYNLTDNINEESKKLMKSCWPGPLTIIFKKSDKVPSAVTAGLDTVAIRYPKDEIALALISAANTPIAAPSANLSGKPSLTRAIDVYQDLKGRIPLIIDGGSCDIGIESTVIDLSEEVPTILRPGFYTYEYIKEILPNVRLDDSIVDSKKTPKSPGQKYTHYAPKARMEIFVGEKASDEILKKAIDEKEKGKKVGVLIFEDQISKFKDFKLISLGNREELNYMSHVLFTSLRMMDDENVDLILAEGVSEEGLGKSIMNRMKKSASFNVNYV